MRFLLHIFECYLLLKLNIVYSKQMVEHYFQEKLTDAHKKRIEEALSIPLKTTPSAYQMYGNKGFTPAEVRRLYIITAYFI